MNYQRIYNEFISDRKTKKINGYSEKHHIIPRMIGGKDTEDNLIKLTPEDHLFAHLLLAKTYGGKHWFAVKMMLEVEPHTKTDRLITSSKRRYAFGTMRRNVAQYYSDNYSGINSPASDKKKYKLNHIDGRTTFGNRFELSKKTKLTRGLISGLILGTSKSAHGWYNPLVIEDGVIGYEIFEKKRIEDSKRFYMYDKNKKEHYVNRYEAENLMGGKSASTLINAGALWSNGFTLDKNAKEEEVLTRERCIKNSKARGDISGMNNPRADKTVYKFYNYFTKEIFIGTRADMSQKYNLTSIDTQRILSNKYDHNKGWRSGNNYKVMKPNVYTKGMKLYG